MVKLDFSQTSINTVGIVFKAMSTETNTRTKQQLEAEESVGQSSDLSKTKEASKTQEKAISPNDNEQTVLFADPTNGNLVKVNLSKANIEKLKKHFTDENNFFERQDGALRLNGKAEAYVSGWFGDIAYKREFLKADADKDGKLSEDEYQGTRNGYTGYDEAQGAGNNVLSITSSVTDTYMSPQNNSRKRMSESIDYELDFDIKSDGDLNSELSDKEILSGSGKDYRTFILDYAKKYLDDTNPSKGYFSSGSQTDDEELELLTLQSKAEQKLRAANGNENVLSTEEKEALGAELKAIKKQLESKDDLSSVKEELKTKIENTQFIDVRG